MDLNINKETKVKVSTLAFFYVIKLTKLKKQT